MAGGKTERVLTDPNGVGKTWLPCALAHQACRQGHSAYYSLLRRFDDLGIGRADGRYMKLLKQLATINVLLVDDWELAVLDDRHDSGSTITTSQ